MENITAIITTFNRPQSLDKLVNSIIFYYPDLKIIIVDNGEKEPITKYKNVDYYKIPFDSGLSFSRNYGVERVKTKYVLLLDDDFEFTENTKPEKMLEVAEKGFDFVGGNVEGLDYHGILERDGETLRYVKGDRGELNGYKMFDLILNFFLARTDVLKNNKWNDELKLAEHTDFFLRLKGKAKITYLDLVKIRHNHDRNADYDNYRLRGQKFMKLFMEKNKIDKIINYIGEETEISQL